MSGQKNVSPDDSNVDSYYLLSNGKPKVMRIFIVHENERVCMDVATSETVSRLKKRISEAFQISSNQVQLGDENMEKNVLIVNYAGAELPDNWVIADLNIVPGATLKVYIKEETEPILYLHVGYNGEIIPIMEILKIRDLTVSQLRSICSRKTGLPVSVFRVVNKNDLEMYDCHSLETYDIKPGDTIHVETWDGWNDFLNLASLGFTSHVMSKIVTHDEIMNAFQLKVALYMAAHFGHVDLAMTLCRMEVKPEEPVGQHPLKQWCNLDRHVDLLKAAIHECVECNQLGVLRTFVHQSKTCIMARDGNGLQPLNIALRCKAKTCASFLLTKQWSRIPFNSNTISLAIYTRMKTWTDRARDRIQLLYGSEKSSMKKKSMRDYPLIGQGVYVEGYSENLMMSRAKFPVKSSTTRANQIEREFFERMFKIKNAAGGGVSSLFSSFSARSGSGAAGDEMTAEEYFRDQIQNKLRLPKMTNKWTRMAGNNAEMGGRPQINAKFGGGGLDYYSEGASRPNSAAQNDLPGSSRDAVKRSGGNLSKALNKITEDPELNHAQDVSARSETNPNRPSNTRKTAKSTDNSPQHKTKKQMTAAAADTANAGENAGATGTASQPNHSVSASVIAKAKATESSIPLPLKSVDDIQRPFHYKKPNQPDDIQNTLDQYNKHRGMPARDNAIQCLAMANMFTDKQWLNQVRIALHCSEKAVKKPVTSRASNLTNSLSVTSPMEN